MRSFLLSKMSLNVITLKLFLYQQKSVLKNLYSRTHPGGFQFFLVLDLWGISFHAVIVFGLGKNLLFKSGLGHSAYYVEKFNVSIQANLDFRNPISLFLN